MAWRPSLPRLEVPNRDLTPAREVDRLAENPRGFLRRVEPRRVFRLDEVEIELRFPMKVARRLQIGVRTAGGDRALEIRDQRHQRIHRAVAQVEVSLLDRVHAVL